MEAAALGAGAGAVGLVGLYNAYQRATTPRIHSDDSLASKAAAQLDSHRRRFSEWAKRLLWDVKYNERTKFSSLTAEFCENLRALVAVEEAASRLRLVSRWTPETDHLISPSELVLRLYGKDFDRHEKSLLNINESISTHGVEKDLVPEVVKFGALVDRLLELVSFRNEDFGDLLHRRSSSPPEHVEGSVFRSLRAYNYFREQRLPGTCDWVFHNEVYQRWISSDLEDRGPKYLWIHGPAGSGKSVLCANIVESLRKSPDSLVLSYFCPSLYSNIRVRSSIARCWVSFAALNQKVEFDPLHRARDEAQDPRIPEIDVWHLLQAVVRRFRNTILVIDGLDEYFSTQSVPGETCEGFIFDLRKAVANTTTRVLVVSRNEEHIREQLAPMMQTVEQTVSELPLSEDVLRQDVELYSKSLVAKRLDHQPLSFQKEITSLIATNCGGMLQMKLQAEQIHGDNDPDQLRRIVQDMSSDLGQIYRQNWVNIREFGERDYLFVESVLRWLLFSTRAFSVKQLAEAVTLEHCDNFGAVRSDGLSVTHGETSVISDLEMLNTPLLVVRKPDPEKPPGLDGVHLAHRSVKDFLLSAELCPSSPFADSMYQNNVIAQICLRHLDNQDAWEHFSSSSASGDEGRQRAQFLEYAGFAWYDHIRHGGSNYNDVLRLVNNFFAKNNPNWDRWRREFSPVKLDKNKPEEFPGRTYYAAALGLTDTLKFLATQGELDLSKPYGPYGSPLEAACGFGHISAAKFLIDNGADIDNSGGPFGSALNAAIADGHEEVACYMIEKGASAHFKSQWDNTALFYAATSGLSAVVKLLLANGVDKRCLNDQGETPLNIAAYGGHLEIVKLLLNRGTTFSEPADENNEDDNWVLLDEGSYLETANNGGWTPLISACFTSRLEVVHYLVANGANVNATSAEGSGPLHEAAARGDLEIAQFLLENGADPVAENNYGEPPLLVAAQFGHPSIMKALMSKGASLQCRNVSGNTPLMFAAVRGYPDVIQLLLDNGVDLRSAKEDGTTPLHIAAIRGHLHAVKLLCDSSLLNTVSNGVTTVLCMAVRGGNLDVVKYLLDMGAEPNNMSSSENALHFAARLGTCEMIELLLDRGADITLATDQGDTPLHFAAMEESLEEVQLLVERGADLAAVNKFGWTPFLAACYKGSFEVAKFLAERGSDLNARLEGWQTASALHLAAENGNLELVEYLVGKGADVNATDDRGRSPLIGATTWRHPKVMEFLLHKGADYKVTNRWGLTPLLIASYDGNLPIVKLLLEMDGMEADLIHESYFSQTPLMVAAEKGHLDLVQYLLEQGSDVRIVDSEGNSALHMACEYGQPDVVRTLLSNAADPDLPNRSGSTPLIQAVEHPEVVRLLLESGADPHAMNKSRTTALNAAAGFGRHQVVQMLLERGVDLEAADANGFTPLVNAAWRGGFEVVSYLIENNANVHAATKKGSTSLHLAAAGGRLEVIQLLLANGADPHALNEVGGEPILLAALSGRLLVVRYLLEIGADIECADKWGCTPLNVAAARGHTELVRYLLGRGADAEAAVTGDIKKSGCDLRRSMMPRAKGSTALASAADYGHLEVVRLLLEHGANAKCCDDKGWTPLMSACGTGNLEIVQLLLDNGADITAISKNGAFALLLAAGCGHVEIVRLLIARGASVHVKNHYEEWALSEAAAKGQLETFQLLLESRADPLNPMVLISAAKRGHAGIVSLLLGKGADVSANLKEGGDSPLVFAAGGGFLDVVRMLLDASGSEISDPMNSRALVVAARESHLDIVRLLLDRGIDGSKADSNGTTPLFAAVAGGNYEIIELLLNNKAVDPNVTSFYPPDLNYRPLFMACKLGKLEIARLLVSKGADPSLADGLGLTPLHPAVRKGNVELVRLLLDESRVDVNAVTFRKGITPLHFASAAGQFEVVQILLRRGADPALADKTGRTAIHRAAEGGYLEIVCLIHEAGGDIGAPNSIGSSPLHSAATYGHVAVVEYLIKKGAAIDARSFYQSTPLHRAAAWAEVECVELLVKHGAPYISHDIYGRTPCDMLCLLKNIPPSVRHLQYRATEQRDQQEIVRRNIPMLTKRIKQVKFMDEADSLLNAFVSCFMILEDYVAAQATMTKLWLLGYSDGNKHGDGGPACSCDMCGKQALKSFYSCKSCITIELCEDCMEKYTSGGEIPKYVCAGHEFVFFPHPKKEDIDEARGCAQDPLSDLPQWADSFCGKYLS